VKIADGKIVLNDAGIMIKKWFLELPNKFNDIVLDEYIIMPNHIHSIIQNTGYIVGADLRVYPNNLGEHTGFALYQVVLACDDFILPLINHL